MSFWDEAALGLEAGRLCLEFANTAEWHASPQPTEELTSYAALLGWAQKVGLLEASEADFLLSLASRDQAEAERTLAQAIDLRESIYRLFSAVAHGAPAPLDDIERVGSAWRMATQRLRLVGAPNGYRWEWSEEMTLDRPLWPVALSAGDLSTSDLIERVGECADDRGCGWLFLDNSRNRSRRWCGMDGCGNRAKARRHYQRTHSTA
jgi:predicted RNA-binding Zn ribbon-like protein